MAAYRKINGEIVLFEISSYNKNNNKMRLTDELKLNYFIILVKTCWRPNKYYETPGGLLCFKTQSEMKGGIIPKKHLE